MALTYQQASRMTRDYEFTIYKQPNVQGTGIDVPNTRLGRDGDLRKAVKLAKEKFGPGAGIYSITKGRFVGWIHFNGRFVPFR